MDQQKEVWTINLFDCLLLCTHTFCAHVPFACVCVYGCFSNGICVFTLAPSILFSVAWRIVV
uniref:Uncharacterized protein n=1 Tax=Rhizophora mucronata TaxID=61149 RepID=A0A2P2QIF7_RHIMU